MQNSLKTGLLIMGIVLVSFGLYTVYFPDYVVDAGESQVTSKFASMETRSIVLLGLGVLALLTSFFYKKNK